MSENYTYESFVKNINTGDILLYRGNYWYSKIIEYFTGSNYSHISIILKNPIWLNNKLTEDYYILESGYEDIYNMDSMSLCKNLFGVKIVPLKKIYQDSKIKGYDLYIRKLVTNKLEIDINNSIIKCFNLIKDKPYDIHPIDWIEAYINLNTDLDKIIPNKQRTDCFWCSSLITFIYIECGFLDKTIPFTLITPKDWSYYGYIPYGTSRLKFLNCELTSEVKILLES